MIEFIVSDRSCVPFIPFDHSQPLSPPRFQLLLDTDGHLLASSQKEVYVDRLTIENTVEQRISEMQIRKQGLADASMGEGGGAKLGKLSVADVANLFGLRANGQRL